MMRQTVFVSATPADYEAEQPAQVVEQVVRPTGLVDPEIEVRPAATQVDDLLSEINVRVKQQRARAGHHADQAHGRGADRLPCRARHQGALPAFGHRHRRAGRDHPRPAAGRVRRAGRHQPAARGPGHPRSVAGGDPGCRQGRLSALGALADPDHRAAPRATSTARRILYADHVTDSMQRAIDGDRAPAHQADRVQRKHTASRRRASASASRTSSTGSTTRTSAQDAAPRGAGRGALRGDEREADLASEISSWRRRCSSTRATWSSSRPPSCATS